MSEFLEAVAEQAKRRKGYDREVLREANRVLAEANQPTIGNDCTPGEFYRDDMGNICQHLSDAQFLHRGKGVNGSVLWSVCRWPLSKFVAAPGESWSFGEVVE